MTTIDERIEAARKLDGYTPGPWYQGSHVPESASVWIGGRAKEGGGAVLPYLAKTMNWPANYSANALLIAAAPDLHRLVLDLAAERERLLALIKRAESIFANCSVTDGSCCCGEDMENHSSPMSCGHMPVDHGAYQVDLWIKDLETVTHNQENTNDEG